MLKTKSQMILRIAELSEENEKLEEKLNEREKELQSNETIILLLGMTKHTVLIITLSLCLKRLFSFRVWNITYQKFVYTEKNV